MRKYLAILFIMLPILLSGQGRYPFYTPVGGATPTYDEDVWYLFDDNSDEVGSNDFTNTGLTFVSSPTPPEGSNWAYSASVLGTYATLPSSYYSVWPTDFSVAFWFRTPNTGTGVRLMVNGTYYVTGLTLRLNATGNDFDVFTNTTEISANNFGTAVNADNHFVVTYESSTGYVDIIINGVSRVSNGAGATGITMTNAMYLMNNAVGYMDDFRVFPRIISTAEANTLYTNPGDAL